MKTLIVRLREIALEGTMDYENAHYACEEILELLGDERDTEEVIRIKAERLINDIPMR